MYACADCPAGANCGAVDEVRCCVGHLLILCPGARGDAAARARSKPGRGVPRQSAICRRSRGNPHASSHRRLDRIPFVREPRGSSSSRGPPPRSFGRRAHSAPPIARPPDHLDWSADHWFSAQHGSGPSARERPARPAIAVRQTAVKARLAIILGFGVMRSPFYPRRRRMISADRLRIRKIVQNNNHGQDRKIPMTSANRPE